MSYILLNSKIGKWFLRTSLFLAVLTVFSCSSGKHEVSYDFNNIPDRIWTGEDLWTIPMEDWQVKSGRLETSSRLQNASVSVLPWVLTDSKKPFSVSVKIGLLDKGENDGSAGLFIGVEASEEKDVRAAVYFGQGIRAGISSKGFAFIGLKTKTLPENFILQQFRIELSGKPSGNVYTLSMKLFDSEDNPVLEITDQTEGNITGIIKLINNFVSSDSKNNGPRYWYDDLILTGSKFENQPANRFGPVLWTMYTLSRNTLKMTAQLPPLGETENREATLQVQGTAGWTTLQTAKMDPYARTVTWKIEDWDMTTPKNYRVTFDFINVFGNKDNAEYQGEIRKEPENSELRLGAMTCQYHYGFPYSPLVKNLSLSKPDLLYFSGDQIYEQNGGYPIKRYPEDVSILSYLGKWYMFGWAFGDLMRNTPTICTPDDHDVFHGNLWGEEGMLSENQKLLQTGATIGATNQGFAQSVGFVDVVNRTQCEHLPDPYDPTPIQQGMRVWYTSLDYGKISFAIVSDRIFKSGPTRVATWETRPDHLLKPLKDPSILDKPELEMLGKRQEKFLEEWIRDWKNVDMKVLLSQTLFANVATHHGNWDGYLLGDLDSGGWPKGGRDRALGIMRKGFVFHIAGDQHVPSLVHYGIDNYRDAGWCFVTPAIAVGYSRWFRPDEIGIPAVSRPEHGHPNTGEYKDAFGNLNYVYAIGNPGNFSNVSDRYMLANIKSSGYAMIIFNNNERTINMESWHFLADLSNLSKEDQFPGWPFTISQFDNYGREAKAWLPRLKISGNPDPVVEITNQRTGELEYIVRIKGNEFDPKVFSNDIFSIRVGYPEQDIWKVLENIKAVNKKDSKEMVISF